uniref:Decapping nuclease n=1 Tax=Ditylenchus dipsaci TaxID=166011 RepID=A0A915DAX6_9BILA
MLSNTIPPLSADVRYLKSSVGAQLVGRQRVAEFCVNRKNQLWQAFSGQARRVNDRIVNADVKLDLMQGYTDEFVDERTEIMPDILEWIRRETTTRRARWTRRGSGTFTPSVVSSSDEEEEQSDDQLKLLNNALKTLDLKSGNDSTEQTQSLPRLKQYVQNADVVADRSVISKIASSPYDTKLFKDFSVKVACILFKGVLFLCEFPTDIRQEGTATLGFHQRRALYWATTSKIWSPLSNNRSHGKTPIKILFGGTVDALSPNGRAFMQLKVQYKSIGHNPFKFEQKCLKWFLQCYLEGTRDILVGIRDQKGLVFRTELLAVDDLPIMVANGTNAWTTTPCLTFMHIFLKYVRKHLEELPEGVILMADRKPKRSEFEFQVLNNDHAEYPQHNFLSDEFKKCFA